MRAAEPLSHRSLNGVSFNRRPRVHTRGSEPHLRTGGSQRYSGAIADKNPPGRRHDEPWAYFITFACYGDRLHGDDRGSVDRLHNSYGGRLLEADSRRVRVETKLMWDTGAALDREARVLVLRTMREVCVHQQWTLYAIHARRTHVHAVVCANVAPEEVMRKLKAYSSRALNERFGFRKKRWTRHGSTRRLWSPAQVDATVDYVVRRQGEPMAVYEDCDRWADVLR